MGRFLDYIKNTEDLFDCNDPIWDLNKEIFLNDPKGVMKDWLRGNRLGVLNYLFSWGTFVERTGLCSVQDITSIYEQNEIEEDEDEGEEGTVFPTNRFYQLLLKELSPTRPLKNYFPEIVSDV